MESGALNALSKTVLNTDTVELPWKILTTKTKYTFRKNNSS